MPCKIWGAHNFRRSVETNIGVGTRIRRKNGVMEMAGRSDAGLAMATMHASCGQTKYDNMLA